MILQYNPCPALQDFVSRFTIVRYQLDPTKPRPTNPFPPQPSNCLYFYPYDQIIGHDYVSGRKEAKPRSMIVGPQLSRVDLTMGYNMLVIIVFFNPGGMHRLLRLPMEEILGMPLDATLVLGREIEEITEQLNEACDFIIMIEIIQQYLVKKINQLKGSLPIDHVLKQMLLSKQLVNIDVLANLACVSVRQLERQFRERVGMPPKVFSRLVRFSKAWVMHEKNANDSWLSIAHACDYADQMHMIRDFKDFVGVTPGNLQSDLEKSELRLQGTTID